MTNGIKIFTFSGKHTKNPKLKKCKKCSVKFRYGEWIVSRHCGSSTRRRYHKKCAEEYNMI